MKQTARHTVQQGFTLTELTIVLVIVAFLLGGMLLPLSAQRDLRDFSAAQQQLVEIKEALMGFAIINGRFPCPTSESDPANARYGIEDATCNNVEGYLPWKSLGLSETDPWGSRRTASSTPFSGYWRYRVDNNFSQTFMLSTQATSGLSVTNAAGNSLTQSPPNGPVAIIYSTGPDLTANGENATIDTTFQAGERSTGFDDILVWISRPLLFNRMIAAGKLP